MEEEDIEKGQFFCCVCQRRPAEVDCEQCDAFLCQHCWENSKHTEKLVCARCHFKQCLEEFGQESVDICQACIAVIKYSTGTFLE